MANRPAPEIAVDEPLVRALLDEQAPDLATLPLQLIGRGWDNTNWRLGEDLTVRLPHRVAAAALVENEQRWLPVLAPRFDLAIPAPVVAGRPDAAGHYPWRWTIARWLPGVEAAQARLDDAAGTAAAIGTFFRQLHVDAPADGPRNPYRGGPIAERGPHLSERLDSLGARVDATAARALFADATGARSTDERVWVHGDLHTRNVLVADGAVSAVIDWGDICTGDRAVDLALTWMLVPGQLDAVRSRAGADDHAWRRARGWAVHFAVTYLAMGDDDQVMTDIGTRLLTSLDIGVA